MRFYKDIHFQHNIKSWLSKAHMSIHLSCPIHYSFNNYLLSNCCMPGTVLGTEDTPVAEGGNWGVGRSKIPS